MLVSGLPALESRVGQQHAKGEKRYDSVEREAAARRYVMVEHWLPDSDAAKAEAGKRTRRVGSRIAVCRTTGVKLRGSEGA